MNDPNDAPTLVETLAPIVQTALASVMTEALNNLHRELSICLHDRPLMRRPSSSA